jgi:putative oxidoreductase
MRDFGILSLRLVCGGLIAGHGAQKLFGWFGGQGPQGTGGWLESMGFKPGDRWAVLAGLGEFGGGTLTALGLLHPIGPVTTLGPMLVATFKAHAGKPIWVTSGGAELPVVNMTVALSLICMGAGRFSLDRMMPAVAVLSAAGVVAGTLVAISNPPELALERSAAQSAQQVEPVGTL